METINYSNNMSNNSENKEISPGLSLQNDFDQNQQNEENEKYTEPILERNKLDVKRQQRWHCEICYAMFKNRRILKDHQDFFHEMENNWEEDDNKSETESENDYDFYRSHSFEMFSQNSKESEKMEKNYDFNNQNEDKPPHSSLDPQENKKKKKYTCDQCEKEYFHSQNLLRHKRIVHERYSCRKCKKEFSDKVTLKNHIDSAHTRKKYSCGGLL